MNTFGFLTFLEDPRHGFFGGYLVLSARGRPLEFRCSTPVLPTRAQQILYGTTLRPYVLAEVLGQALVASAQSPVRAILTDAAEMLELALLRSEEVLWVHAVSSGEGASRAGVESSAASAAILPRGAAAGDRGVRLAPFSSLKPEEVVPLLGELAQHVDLLEPFERIRTALREAGQIPEPASPDDSAHDAAA